MSDYNENPRLENERAKRYADAYDKLYAKAYPKAHAKGYTGAYADAYASGYAEGYAEGRAEGVASVALNLLRRGLDADFIASATGLPIEKIRQMNVN